MAKLTVTVNKIDYAATHSSVTVTLTPVIDPRAPVGMVGAKAQTRIFIMPSGPVTIAAIQTEVIADLKRQREQREIVGASFEVDV
jgi:hypothetical protein